jgi:mono/diheme cytochrome c family protein
MKVCGLIVALCFVFFTVTTGSAQASPADLVLTSNPVFRKNCAKCHGKRAEGRHFAGPSLKSDTVASASTSELNTIITNGKGRMPKFTGKLTPEEIVTLVEQVNSLNGK